MNIFNAIAVKARQRAILKSIDDEYKELSINRKLLEQIASYVSNIQTEEIRVEASKKFEFVIYKLDSCMNRLRQARVAVIEEDFDKATVLGDLAQDAYKDFRCLFQEFDNEYLPKEI